MFSFVGDTVLDPFLGSGTTTAAAIQAGRNSIGVEAEPSYVTVQG
jgi:DNA modification methylase